MKWMGTWCVCQADQALLEQRVIEKEIKTRVFNAVVASTLLYGAGTWTRQEQPTRMLKSVKYTD